MIYNPKGTAILKKKLINMKIVGRKNSELGSTFKFNNRGGPSGT